MRHPLQFDGVEGVMADADLSRVVQAWQSLPATAQDGRPGDNRGGWCWLSAQSAAIERRFWVTVDAGSDVLR